MPGIRVEVHEPVNVLSTMLLTLTRVPKGAKLHPIAAKAFDHTKPFADHPSLAWLKEFFRPGDPPYLYGHAAQLSGPITFMPRSLTVPPYVARYEPERMKDLSRYMSDFYRDAKLGTFRRQTNAEYTLAAADVKDALERGRIEEYLRQLYGKIPYDLVVVPVPTHPFAGGATARTPPGRTMRSSTRRASRSTRVTPSHGPSTPTGRRCSCSASWPGRYYGTRC